MTIGGVRTKPDGGSAEQRSCLTGPRLKELFECFRIIRGAKHNSPSDEGFARLAASLNGLAALIGKYRGPLADNVQRRVHVSMGIAMLHGALPGLIKDIDAEIERNVGTMKASGPDAEYLLVEAKQLLESRYLRGIEALRRLQLAVTEMEHYPSYWLPVHLPPLDQWHQFVQILVDDFLAAMSETNPGVTIGLSKDGPVGRYCVRAIELLTGEQTTTESVIAHLRRQRKSRTA
jgi:hypothetical protein